MTRVQGLQETVNELKEYIGSMGKGERETNAILYAIFRILGEGVIELAKLNDKLTPPKEEEQEDPPRRKIPPLTEPPKSSTFKNPGGGY